MAYLMIIDDDEDFASAMARVLRDDGYDVEVQLEIATAIQSMEQKRPDLLILDVMFPENASAGFELARTIRHYDEKLKGIPVLMVTAINAKFPLGFGTRDIDDVWLPVADFLEKPLDLDTLRKKVADLLQGKSKRAETRSQE